MKNQNHFLGLSRYVFFQNKTYSFLFTLLILVWSSTSVFCQPDIAWERTYGGELNDRCHFIKATPDGGFITGSLAYSIDGDVSGNNGKADFWIVKTTSTGEIEWGNNYGGSEYESPTNVELTPDGGYIIIGYSGSSDGDINGTNKGNWDVWVIKLNASGELEWENNYGGSGDDRGFDIANVDIGGYMFVAHTYSGDGDLSNVNYNGTRDIWVAYISETGALLSHQSHGGTGLDAPTKIVALDDGHFMVGGSTRSDNVDISFLNGDSDYWLFKVNLQADLIWEKTYGGSGSENLNDFILTDDGGFLLVGFSSSSDFDVSTNFGYTDRWMLKLNEDGVKEWDKNFGDDTHNNFKNVAQLVDGKYVLVDENLDISLVDELGNEEWTWTFDNQDYANYNFFDITASANGGFAVTGSAQPPGSNNESYVINFQSLSSTGCPDNLNGFVELGEFNGHKYYLSEGTSGAPAAQDVADANGGYLATINSQEENDFIQQNISEMVYIGLNDFDSEGNLVWANGEPFNFDNINPCGFCNENSDDQDFLIIQPWDGAWSFSNIFNQRKYLIEVPCNTITPPTNPDDCAFVGSFPNEYDPYEICIEENQDGYQFNVSSKIDPFNPNVFFQTNASIGFDGDLVDYFNSPPIDPASQSNFLSFSKGNPWMYVYDTQQNKVRVCDYNLAEMWNFCFPSTPTFIPNMPVPIYSNLNAVQVLELDNELVLIVMDSYVGLFQNQVGGNAILENANFVGGTFFGKPVPSNDGGYYIHVDNNIVKINATMQIEWISSLAISDANVAILPIPNNDDAFYTFIKNYGEESVLKIDNDFGSLIYSKDLNTFVPADATWGFPKLRNGVATLDGGFVTKIDYQINQTNDLGSVLIKLDGDGNTVWECPYPEEYWNYEVNFATSDGGYMMTDYENGELNYLKTNSLGKLDLCDALLLPDLKIPVVEFLHIGGPGAGAMGDTVCVDFNEIFYYFEVVNEGDADVLDDYQIRIYLSEDGILDSGDSYVQGISGLPVMVNESVFFEGIVSILNIAEGDYQFIVTVDYGDDIAELDEDNNITFGQSYFAKDCNSNPSNCPDDIQGFTPLGEFAGSKYFISNDVENPIPAQTIAENLGGYLATIDSQEENDFIYSQISDLAYIGINDADNEDELEWGNGDPVSFTNFDLCGICNENSEEMDYVVMHSWNGGWSWSNVFNQRKYIVEIPCPNTVTAPPNTLIAFLPNVLNQEEVGESILRLEKLYPNPANEFIFVKINSSEEANIDLQIFDARGVLIKTKNANLSTGENIIQLKIEELPTGFYSILIPKAEQGFTTIRFVK